MAPELTMLPGDVILLSRSVRGIFINFPRFTFSEFFSRPSTGPAICGGLDFLPCTMGVKVTDHCNGLLLCRDQSPDDARPCEYVVNPATRRWTRLPQRPRPHVPGSGQTAYLAFEPAVSSHYEVFLIPCVPAADESDDDDDDNPLLESEWPPASYVMHVFSSATQRWDETTFLREGEAAGIVANMHTDSEDDRYRYRAVYWQSALYVHCQHGYLTRMSLLDHTYSVIKLPNAKHPNRHLGRSVRGVYFAISCSWDGFLQLWYLNESCSRTEWVLKHDTHLQIFEHEDQLGRRWILQDVNHRKWFFEHNGNKYGDYRAPVEEKYDWNSDEDNIIDIEDNAGEGYHDGLYFLGFHPYKEIAFLISSGRGARGMAYDWNNLKFQDLGNVCPADFDPSCGLPRGETDTAFPYTPCWIGEFPGNELESLLEDEELSMKKLELEEESNFTCMDEYELRKFCGHAKRVKDRTAKIRHRRRTTAR
ncbi:unnamed protein product [Triticum turgidum subsp. durum]|uniref:F-box associated domain-containing protein n=1 Tax=Triticum turgidum subsp. durum TaxID=4567 RepID=A0A9R0QY90_TRITD|nr:unnamed protein product [Triticum turgidum subsp. durum]